MTKIKHIAIRTPDPEKTANFYKEVFGLEEVGLAGSGFYLSDGHINLAILKSVDVGDKSGFAGVDHFGFQVDNVEETQKRLADHGAEALTSHAPPGGGAYYYELKYLGPDRQVVDVSGSGWVGTD